jgi:hypothetical protein
MRTFIALLSLITSIASAQTIICPPDAPANYVYLRTGEL